MPLPYATRLPHRNVIRIDGDDRASFLQALVSNDVTKATDTKAVYAALLSPQGKFLHDMFILEHEKAFLIDCEAARADDLLQRFSAYKLRSKVTLGKRDDFDVWALWNAPYAASLSFIDPRFTKLGFRAFRAKGTVPAEAQLVEFDAYDQHRLMLGVADGSRDLEIDKSTLAEGNFSYLNGVDWEKGCYVGQELTARMHYRRLGKKRLFPVRLSGIPAEENALLYFRGEEVGYMRSYNGNIGLALITYESVDLSILQKVPLNCGNFGASPFYPDWLILD